MSEIAIDTNMKFAIMQIEAHYLMLIYKYIFGHFVSDDLYNDLFCALEYYAKKSAEIFDGLQDHGSIIMPEKPLDPEKSEQIIFFDFLANFCFVPTNATIETYTIKPDQKNANKTYAEKERLCKTLLWTVGHITRLCFEVRTLMNVSSTNQDQELTQAKN